MNKKRWGCTEHNFAVEGIDEAEIIMMVKMHMKEKHDMEVSDEEIRAKIHEA